jgi:hypothetical protein
MKPLLPILATLLLLGGCSNNRLPEPYTGFVHTSPEHGYWKEVASDKQLIGELHFHTKGFSITYNPFETYKDYWGSYTMDNSQTEIRITVDGGNKLPEFPKATGDFHQKIHNEISISGIALDSRRPNKKQFRFERLRPNP